MPKKRHEEASRWYHQACYDLKAVAWNIEGGFYDTACFLAQQAGEKALKSLLYVSGARRKALLTHSVFEMVREVARTVESLGTLLEQARELDLHYIPARYPNGLPSGYPHLVYSRDLAERAQRAAEALMAAIKTHYEAHGILAEFEEKGDT
ncbi:MAG: HEPN domain-containing protein [Nitrospiraceae bacterium]